MDRQTQFGVTWRGYENETGIVLIAALLSFSTNAFRQDPNFYIFLCLGQSNMEGFPGIEEQDKHRG